MSVRALDVSYWLSCYRAIVLPCDRIKASGKDGYCRNCLKDLVLKVESEGEW